METVGDESLMYYQQVVAEHVMENAWYLSFVVTETLRRGFVVMEAVPGAERGAHI